jgi:hypothetical protein
VTALKLKSLAAKWAIERRPRAWLFTCRACGDEYKCTCFPSGALTPRQLKHLRYHRHTQPRLARGAPACATGAMTDLIRNIRCVGERGM